MLLLKCVAIFRETRNGSVRFRERKIGDSYAFGGPRRPASATACAVRGATAPTVTDAGSGAFYFVSTRATAAFFKVVVASTVFIMPLLRPATSLGPD